MESPPPQRLLEPEDFSFETNDVNLYAPTKKLSRKGQHTVPASSLKLGEDFIEVTDEDYLKTQFIEKAKEVLSDYKSSNGDRMISKTVCAVYERCDRLRSSGGTATREELIRNEATLRYAISDPIMDMFCDMEGLKVYLEESVVMLATPTPQSDPSTPTKPTNQVAMEKTTPSTMVSVTPSKQSRCDYACYTLRKDGGILAIIIEAKMEESSQEAVAQLMGYVSAFAKDCHHPPLAIVVTQTRVECLLFPFIKEGDGERLLKAAAFTLDLWKQNRCTINQKVFRILGSLINQDVRMYLTVSVKNCNDWEKMRAIQQIVSHEQNMAKRIEELQEDVKKSKERGEALQEAIEKLKGEINTQPTT